MSTLKTCLLGCWKALLDRKASRSSGWKWRKGSSVGDRVVLLGVSGSPMRVCSPCVNAQCVARVVRRQGWAYPLRQGAGRDPSYSPIGRQRYESCGGEGRRNVLRSPVHEGVKDRDSLRAWIRQDTIAQKAGCAVRFCESVGACGNRLYFPVTLARMAGRLPGEGIIRRKRCGRGGRSGARLVKRCNSMWRHSYLKFRKRPLPWVTTLAGRLKCWQRYSSFFGKLILQIAFLGFLVHFRMKMN